MVANAVSSRSVCLTLNLLGFESPCLSLRKGNPSGSKTNEQTLLNSGRWQRPVSSEKISLPCPACPACPAWNWPVHRAGGKDRHDR